MENGENEAEVINVINDFLVEGKKENKNIVTTFLFVLNESGISYSRVFSQIAEERQVEFLRNIPAAVLIGMFEKNVDAQTLILNNESLSGAMLANTADEELTRVVEGHLRNLKPAKQKIYLKALPAAALVKLFFASETNCRKIILSSESLEEKICAAATREQLDEIDRLTKVKPNKPAEKSKDKHDTTEKSKDKHEKKELAQLKKLSSYVRAARDKNKGAQTKTGQKAAEHTVDSTSPIKQVQKK